MSKEISLVDPRHPQHPDNANAGESKKKRGKRSADNSSTTYDGKFFPKNIEDYIRANNAHLQVLLKNQAKMMAMINDIHVYILNRSAELAADDEAGRKQYTAAKEALTKQIEKVGLKMSKADVHQIYLQILMEKYK